MRGDTKCDAEFAGDTRPFGRAAGIPETGWEVEYQGSEPACISRRDQLEIRQLQGF